VDKADFDKMGEPGYRERAEAWSLQREITLSKLPAIRNAQAAARARNDQAEVDRLEAEYEKVLLTLDAMRAP
jgi:hypothetical protein